MFSLRNVLLRKLVYPLPATTFTKEQCQTIMSPILAQGLPSAGFIRTFPHALAHGPLKFCGINIPNLFTEQTLAHIHTLIKFSNQAQDLTGFLLRASGEFMRLELGWTGQLFEAPLILQELITDLWLKHTWLATREADLHLMIDIPDFPLQRHGDKEIVRAFLQHGFRYPQLEALHRCQMFLQVLRFSDICTGTGDRLITKDWRKYQPMPSCYHWPKVVKPSAADWNMWELALSKVFNLGRNQTLPLQLGEFFQSNQMGWYFAPDENALWYSSGSEWRRHGKIPSRTRTMSFHSQGINSTPTAMLRRATVHILPTKVILTGSGWIKPATNLRTGLQRLQELQFVQDWSWELTIVGNLHDLLDDVRSGNGFSVSDGSFEAGKGAAAWIIEGKTSENRLIGKCLCPGADESHSSFRSELARIYAILLTVNTLIQEKSTTTKFQLACDGKSVLQRLRRTTVTDPNEAHADLLSAARHLMKQWGYMIDLQHVKGHQDSKHFGPYKRDATLNIEADKLAKEKLATYRTGPVRFHIPGSQGVCYAGTHRIEKDFANTIRDHMNGQKTTEYWLKRRGLTQGIWNTIDWESIGWAMKELPINRRRWVSKYVSGHFATGKNMQRWKF